MYVYVSGVFKYIPQMEPPPPDRVYTMTGASVAWTSISQKHVEVITGGHMEGVSFGQQQVGTQA